MVQIDPKSLDWRIMIILDACRYDCFKEVNFIPGKLVEMDSGVYNTPAYYNKYWDRYNDNAVWISSVPIPRNEGRFKGIFYLCLFDNWWSDIKQQLQRIEDIVLHHQACESKDTRIIIHLLPPHIPWHNPEGKKFLESLDAFGKGTEFEYAKLEKWAKEHDGGWSTLKDLYKKEIKYVLELIMKTKIDPDVITGDHGEMIGEGNRFIHAVHPIVTKVPWLEIEK